MLQWARVRVRAVWLCGCVVVWLCVGCVWVFCAIHLGHLAAAAFVGLAILGAAKQGRLALSLALLRWRFFACFLGGMACADAYVSMGNDQVDVCRQLGGDERSISLLFSCAPVERAPSRRLVYKRMSRGD